jgi:hypothetical protein
MKHFFQKIIRIIGKLCIQNKVNTISIDQLSPPKYAQQPVKDKTNKAREKENQMFFFKFCLFNQTAIFPAITKFNFLTTNHWSMFLSFLSNQRYSSHYGYRVHLG